jgi:hypothetical protein
MGMLLWCLVMGLLVFRASTRTVLAYWSCSHRCMVVELAILACQRWFQWLLFGKTELDETVPVEFLTFLR